MNGPDQTGAAYCSKYGVDGRRVSGTVVRALTSEAYVEADTGGAITFTGGNVMQCNGANCVVSTTGVVLTNNGKCLH